MKTEKAKKPHNYSVEMHDTGTKMPMIYLSGPITGIPNYKKDFEAVEAELLIKGYRKIINPASLEDVIVNGDYEDYMEVCIKLLDMSDIVILLPGWEKSAGANREYGYALAKNKIVVTYEGLEIEEHS